MSYRDIESERTKALTERAKKRARNVLIDEALRAVLRKDLEVSDRMELSLGAFSKLDLRSRKQSFDMLEMMMSSEQYELSVHADFLEVYRRLQKIVTIWRKALEAPPEPKAKAKKAAAEPEVEAEAAEVEGEVEEYEEELEAEPEPPKRRRPGRPRATKVPVDDEQVTA